MNPEPARTVDILASRSSRSPGVRLQPCFLFMWHPSRLKSACCGRYDIAVPLSDLKCRQVLFENDLGYTNSQRTAGCVISLIVNSSVCVCVFFPFILDIKFVGRTSRDHTGGRSHRISHPPSFCGACLNFSREKDSAIPFSRRL